MEDFNLEQIFSAIDESTGSESGTALKTFTSFLALPDENFLAVKDMVLAEFEKGFNNKNDKLLLAQSLNLTNTKIEDIATQFEEVANKLSEEIGEKYGKVKSDFIVEILAIMLNALADIETIGKRIVQVQIEKVNENAIIPTYAHLDDAGMDVYATKDYNLAPGEQVIIPLGFKIAIPNGYAVLVQPRSGLSSKTKLRICNTPGLIDSGYRGEVGVIIENIDSPIKDITYDFDENGHPVITSILHGQSYQISKGDRIAQLRLVEVPKIGFYEVDSVSETMRGQGGFGSTGV